MGAGDERQNDRTVRGDGEDGGRRRLRIRRPGHRRERREGRDAGCTQSHGQSLMSYFKARYKIEGLYLLDEPETALSPRSQLQLLNLLRDMGQAGHAQFIIATHSPILLACPEATIYSFDHIPVKEVGYEETDYYRLYKSFMEDRSRYLDCT